MNSQFRGRPANREISHSPDVIHYDSETPDLNYMIRQIMLTDLMNSRIKPIITSLLTVVNNTMTRKMKTIWTSKIVTLTNIQVDQRRRVVDLLREDNARLQGQWRTSLERYEGQWQPKKPLHRRPQQRQPPSS